MNQYGKPSELADALDDYNIWRRGADRPAPDPVALGRIIEAAAHTLRDLEREVTHWKANHATEVRRARILKERPDMPMERVAAYHQWEYDLASLFRMTDEVKRLRNPPRFPVELRKMWSGQEVQKWLDEHFARP